jgi:Holliday junction resolvase RusA-like endonuclease
VSGTLTLPWSVLAHDNHRFIPRRGGKGLIAAPGYRKAKADAVLLLSALWRGAPLGCPVELTARAYVPDARKRDVGNYRKLITDALTGIAYTDDSLVHREVWERAGIDRTNPRIEVTVTPLP